MTRRASLPGAEELFRRTAEPEPEAEKAPEQGQQISQQVNKPTSLQVADAGPKAPRHDEKVTFYCTGTDLTRLERARLELRAEHGLASDRGKIVRSALAEILDDFESRGANSALVRRLQAE